MWSLEISQLLNGSTLLFLILSSFTILNCVSASKYCHFTAIFNFGDSNSDTGGLASAFPAFLGPPYGETFFHEPAGRFSDARLVIDFNAESLKLPYVNAYLDSLGTNKFNNGANFATASSTIKLPNRIIPGGGFSPFFLDVQYTQFVRLKSTFQKYIKYSRERANSTEASAEDDYFEKALYTFDIGQNDLGQAFFENKSFHEVKASIPDIVNAFSTNIQKIYNISGGKSYWIHNTGPIGCLPYILATFPLAERDKKTGCAKAFNEVAQYFNHILKQAIIKLRTQLHLASITYVDVYSVKHLLFTKPRKYGFQLPLVSCCGYGGKYNYSNIVGCGGTITVNRTKILVNSCKQASVRVSWDGIHYTESANKFVSQQISTGKMGRRRVNSSIFREEDVGTFFIIFIMFIFFDVVGKKAHKCTSSNSEGSDLEAEAAEQFEFI